MQRKTQIELLQAAKAELEVNVPTSSLIADIAYILKEPELPFTDGYTPTSIVSGSAANGKLTLRAKNVQGNAVVLPTDKTFDGKAYVPELDKERLSRQLDRVFEYMKCFQWCTLSQISAATAAPEASASACLRDLRKERNGSHTVHMRRKKGMEKTGIHEYKLELNTPQNI